MLFMEDPKMLRRTVVLITILFLTASSAGTEEQVISHLPQPVPVNVSVPVAAEGCLAGTPMPEGLWRYLRAGLNHVESSGKEVPTDFVHAGGVAYGPLAMTKIAIKDVSLRHKELSHYTAKDVLSSKVLYEKFAVLYADMLLSHYLKLEYWKLPREKVFDILQRAWFLGPGLYKKGHDIISSRALNARVYLLVSSHA